MWCGLGDVCLFKQFGLLPECVDVFFFQSEVPEVDERGHHVCPVFHLECLVESLSVVVACRFDVVCRWEAYGIKAIEVSHVLIDGNAQFFVFAILVSFYEALHGTGVVEKIEHIDESASVVAYGDVAFFLGGKSFFVLEFSD